MFAKSTAAIVLFASFAAAQSGGTTSNSTIDPNSVSATLRSQWCSAEINTCGTLCSGNIDSNNCDPTTLNYTCTCSSNGSTPGLQYYTDTMPYFICEQIFQNCITAGENDQAAQTVCKENEANNCGHLDPANFTSAATTSSSSSSSASATAASTASSSASSSTSKAAAATMMAMGREYGSGVVAVGVAAAFGLML